MSIQVNPNAVNSLSWETLLSSLGEVHKTDSVDGKESFTITANVEGGPKTITVSIPDDLEIPASVDQGTLNGLVDKLAATGLGFSTDQVAQMKGAISQLYTKAAGALNEVSSSSKGHTMFDLYALMALMIDVAQSQRDAARELRTAQNMAVQKSIQNQADQQRAAATVGMIIGIVCGAVTALVSVGTMVAQGVTASQQSRIAAQSGADAAKMHSTALQNTDTKANAEAQLNRTAQDVGNDVATRVGNDFDAQMVDDQYGNVRQNFLDAKDNLDAKQADYDAKKADLQVAQETLAQRTAANLDTREAAEAVGIKQRDVNLAATELATAKTDFAKAKADYVKTVQDVAAQYQERYQTAVDRLNNPSGNADAAQLKADVESARTDMKMAFAKEADLLAQDDVMTPSEQKDMVAVARACVDTTMDRVYQRADFKEAERKMSTLMGVNNINQAVGNVLQSTANNLAALRTADATRQGSETTKEEEMLDQTKDLFKQEQNLIEQVIQLFTAVVQAENQSMRDAIQA